MGFLSALFGKKNETAPQQESSEPRASDNYAMFRTLYGDYKVAKGYINKAEAGQRFLDYCATIDKHEIDRKIRAELRTGKDKNYSGLYGYLPASQSPYDAILENVERSHRIEAHRADECRDVTHAVAAIPRTKIELDESTVLHRLALSDMPIVSYTGIGTAFNRDRLPAFVVLSVETNGLKVQGGRILKLSAIRYEDYEPIAAFETLVNPGTPIPPEATAVNGITDADVAGAPTLSQVATSFVSFLGSSAIIGYSLPFDLKFLFSRGIDIVSTKRRFYDMLPLVRKVYSSDLDSFNLDEVLENCHIYADKPHSGLTDCYLIEKVFEHALDDLLE